MKMRKQLNHNDLVQEIINQQATIRFTPNVPLIKVSLSFHIVLLWVMNHSRSSLLTFSSPTQTQKCIGILIDKEYLEREKNEDISDTNLSKTKYIYKA